MSYVTSPAGTYVQFACDVNQTASDGTERDGNGLFTKHLLEHIKNPDEDILQIFQRVQGGVLNESRSIPKQSPLGINKLTTSGRIYLKDTPYIIISKQHESYSLSIHRSKLEEVSSTCHQAY